MLAKLLMKCLLGGCLLVQLWLLFVASVEAQDIAAEERLIEQPPFDTLVLKDPPQAFQIQPLAITPRQPIEQITPDRVFEVRLLKRPDRRFRIRGEALAKIVLFEERVLEEVAVLAANGEFNKAYEDLRFLEQFSPNFPGLKEAYAATLMAEAMQHHRRGDSERAWLVLLELTKRSPQAAGAASLMLEVARDLIRQELADRDDRSARARFDLFIERYPNHEGIPALGDPLRRAANAALEQSRESAAMEDWAQAFAELRRAQRLWPQLPGLKEFYRELQANHPVVVVGVRQLGRGGLQRPGDWAATRDSFLEKPYLVYPQLTNGVVSGWQSAIGEWRDIQGGAQLHIPKTANDQTVSDARQWLLRQFSAPLPWEPTMPLRLTDQGRKWVIAGELDVEIARVRLRRGLPAAQRYRPKVDEDTVVWTYADDWFGPRSGAPYQVVAKGTQDLGDLRLLWQQGDLAAVDRIWPWELGQWRRESEGRVGKYAGTTVHLLVVNPLSRYFTDPRTRRAISAAINRQRVIDERLSSGGETVWPLALPLPRGALAQRPSIPRYRPELWASLWNAQSAGDGEQTAQKPQLKLLRSKSPVAARACNAIQEQLELGGLGPRISVVVEGTQPAGDWDLLYLEWYGMDPITDSWPLLAVGGIVGQPPFEFRNLLKTWQVKGVGDRAAAIQELAQRLHENPVVIGLWESEEYYAAQAALNGLSDAPYSLFEHVDQWKHGDGGG